MHGTGWTGDSVFDRLVAFFRAAPGAPIRAEHGDILPVLGQPIDGLDLVRAVLKVLGPRSEHALILLARARAKAKGISAAELCADMGWEVRTMHRRVAVASEDVAAWLNHRAGTQKPLASVIAHEA